MNMTASSSASEFSAGWRIVFASAVGIGFGLSAMPFYTIGVFSAPLAAEFGWDRGQIFLAVFFMMLGTLIGAPIFGYFIDRFGARPLALFSVFSLSITLAALSLAQQQIWTLYALWFLMAGLSSGTLPITWTRAINGWFDQRRGLALGLALAGTGVTAAFLPFYATKLIEFFGWRGAYVGLGITVAVISLPTVYFLFRERADAADTGPTQKPVETGLTIGETLKTYRFWVMAAALFMVSIGVGGLTSNMVPLLTTINFSAEQAAAMAGLVGVSVIAGRVVAGYLIDRFWAPGVAFAFLILPALSCLIFASGGGGVLLTGLAVILVGLAAGAEFDLIAYLISRYFGIKHYGKIYSGQFIFFALASGTAPALFGAMSESAGSYNPILYIAAVLFVAGASLFLTMGRYPAAFEKKEISLGQTVMATDEEGESKTPVQAAPASDTPSGKV